MNTDDLLRRVIDGDDVLLFAEASALMSALLGGELSEQEMEDLLTALHERGETAEELAGFAEAVRAASVRLPLTDAERDSVVDTCGTGGDGSGSFNVSTAVALVAAAAGAMVAKHGNRRVTSRCGSADVLEELGVSIQHDPETAVRALRDHNFAFLLAPHMRPALKAVAPVRRRLPFRTVFNVLGPLVNPAGARRQVIGVYSAEAVPLVAAALAHGGEVIHALVVHGAGGLDELALAGESIVAEVRGTDVRHFTITPEDAGVAPSQAALPGGDAAENAAILRGIFAGEPGPARDITVLNAAAVLVVAGFAESLRDGASLAEKVLNAGGVVRLLSALTATVA